MKYIFETYLGSARIDTSMTLDVNGTVEFFGKMGGLPRKLIVFEANSPATVVISFDDAKDVLNWAFLNIDQCKNLPAQPAVVETPVEELVDANLKTAAAKDKLKTLSVMPPIALVALGEAMADGARKYGAFNWEKTGCTTSVFMDGIIRHALDYSVGENHSPDSRIHHLAHLMAGAAILLDAELKGVLNDDRQNNHDFEYTIAEMRKVIRKEG